MNLGHSSICLPLLMMRYITSEMAVSTVVTAAKAAA